MLNAFIQWLPVLAVVIVVAEMLISGKKNQRTLKTSDQNAVLSLLKFTNEAILPKFVFLIGTMVCLFDFSFLRGFKIVIVLFLPMILIWGFNKKYPFRDVSESLQGLLQNAATLPFLMCGYSYFMIIGDNAQKNLVSLIVPILVALSMVYTLIVLDNKTQGLKPKWNNLSKKPLFIVSIIAISVPSLLAVINSYWPLENLGDLYYIFSDPSVVKTDTLSGAFSLVFQQVLSTMHWLYKSAGFYISVVLIGPLLPDTLKLVLSSVIYCAKNANCRRVVIQKSLIQGFLTLGIGLVIGMKETDLVVAAVVSSGFSSVIPLMVYIVDKKKESPELSLKEIIEEVDDFLQVFLATLVISAFTLPAFAALAKLST